MQNHRGLFIFNRLHKPDKLELAFQRIFFHTIEYTAFRSLVIYKYQIFFLKKRGCINIVGESIESVSLENILNKK